MYVVYLCGVVFGHHHLPRLHHQARSELSIAACRNVCVSAARSTSSAPATPHGAVSASTPATSVPQGRTYPPTRAVSSGFVGFIVCCSILHVPVRCILRVGGYVRPWGTD